jgi:hypothetical protein
MTPETTFGCEPVPLAPAAPYVPCGADVDAVRAFHDAHRTDARQPDPYFRPFSVEAHVAGMWMQYADTATHDEAALICRSQATVDLRTRVRNRMTNEITEEC